MANNYLLKYKTLDQLMAEVRGDLKKMDVNGQIDDSELIKIAQYINRKLGNKLRQEKEAVLYVEKGKVRLPGDFHLLTVALLCFDWKVTYKVIRGDQRTYVEVAGEVPLPGCDPVCEEVRKPCVRYTECGKAYKIIETKLFETVEYTHFGKLHIKKNKLISPFCYNVNTNCVDEGYIKDGFLYTNFDEGRIYINYLGQMEDEDGNLLVLDHDLINPYYEYAIKRRILENIYMGDEQVLNKLNLMEARYKTAKVEAESIINMPDEAEQKAFHNANREAMYRKYYYNFL